MSANKILWTKENATELYNALRNKKLEEFNEKIHENKALKDFYAFCSTLQVIAGKCSENEFVTSLLKGELPTVKLTGQQMSSISGGDFNLFPDKSGKLDGGAHAPVTQAVWNSCVNQTPTPTVKNDGVCHTLIAIMWDWAS